MHVETLVSFGDPVNELPKNALTGAHIVFYFMSPQYPQKEDYVAALKSRYPGARLMGCTTGGEIAGDEALEKSATSAAITLEHAHIKIASTHISDISASQEAGKKLAMELSKPDLRLIFVLSDGLKVNGSELVSGILQNTPPEVIVTGGLAGDGADFKETGVGVDGIPETGVIAAVGFYGTQLKVGYGSVGGWIKFGPERMITKSSNNILYELDNKPALSLYKKYLAEEAEKLPGSGLFFPLSIRSSADSEHDIVRTIVGIDEKAQSLIFAGDVPTGYVAQLMRGNTDSLTEGATQAARLASDTWKTQNSEHSLAILVSCIGRSLLMGQQVSGEVEAVRYILPHTPLVGFYSYGEICHHHVTHKCDLHNQTMTITLLSEAA